MGDPSQEKGAHGEVTHGLGDAEAALVVPDYASPADHPAEGALHAPASREDLEATLRVRLADDRGDEVEQGRLVEQPDAVMARVGK